MMEVGNHVWLNIKYKHINILVFKCGYSSFMNLKNYVGKSCEVLIEKESKKSNKYWCGRNDQNIMVVFPKKNHKPGDFVNIEINDNTSTTLIGTS